MERWLQISQVVSGFALPLLALAALLIGSRAARAADRLARANKMMKGIERSRLKLAKPNVVATRQTSRPS